MVWRLECPFGAACRAHLFARVALATRCDRPCELGVWKGAFQWRFSHALGHACVITLRAHHDRDRASA
eukprot:668803-Rhodomonas_salina.1